MRTQRQGTQKSGTKYSQFGLDNAEKLRLPVGNLESLNTSVENAQSLENERQRVRILEKKIQVDQKLHKQEKDQYVKLVEVQE